MATKVTIDELVTKFVFEVDDKGAKAYEKQLKDGTKTQAKEEGKRQKPNEKLPGTPSAKAAGKKSAKAQSGEAG